jgi:hypothetical protein
MTGETDLATLLSGLRPRLSETEFAFGVVPHGAALPPGIEPVGTFSEAEGLTVIAPAVSFTETGIEHIAGWALITLEVHSSLAAVGMIAAIARALADEGLSTNVVAAFHHDHIFVPWDQRQDAMQVLARFADERVGSGQSPVTP